MHPIPQKANKYKNIYRQGDGNPDDYYVLYETMNFDTSFI